MRTHEPDPHGWKGGGGGSWVVKGLQVYGGQGRGLWGSLGVRSLWWTRQGALGVG